MARADDVNARVNTVEERINNALKLVDELKSAHQKIVDTLNDFRREQEKATGLLGQRVEDMRLNWEKWLMRVWALIGPISGVLLAYFLGIKK